MTYTSSGKQLYSLLKQACNFSDTVDVRTVWAEVLGADFHNDLDLSEKLGQLVQLCNEVKNDIKNLENNNSEKYIRAVNRIQVIFMSQSLIRGTWQSIKAQIREETLDIIDACGELLIAQSKGVNEISSEDLEKLREEIDNLASEILLSEVDSNTKLFLINKLREIEQAIINFQIRGSSGLEKTANQAAGGIILKWMYIPEIAKEKASQVLNMALRASAIMAAYERFAHIAPGMKDLLVNLLPGNGKP